MASESETSITVSDDKKQKYAGPFSEPDDFTDVVLIVEDERLHFNRTVLAMSSPVFQAMFTGAFKEKNAKEIPLPGKTVNDMVLFLEQLHPRHSAKPITDVTLPTIWELADEYEVQTVCQKCRQYVEAQVSQQLLINETKPCSLSNDRLLLYLLMCELCGLKNQRDWLIKQCVLRSSAELKKIDVFSFLPQSVKTELISKRCERLERVVASLQRMPWNNCYGVCHTRKELDNLMASSADSQQ